MNTTAKNYQATSVETFKPKDASPSTTSLPLPARKFPSMNCPRRQCALRPFHKRNEEVYIVVKGKGRFYVDGDEFDVAEVTLHPATCGLGRGAGSRFPTAISRTSSWLVRPSFVVFGTIVNATPFSRRFA